ncbi:MAG: hypothetical protein K8R75_09040, partial [Deltaproteobacteria bacterium]|nr:hypothetical protein [Deltaproteobacteria bacterium]
FPFARFPNVDVILGPEMRSTGEVMGIDSSFGLAFAKSQLAVGQKLPVSGTVFISVKDKDKRAISESCSIRRAALAFDIPYSTTIAGARATALAIKSMIEGEFCVKTIQE